MWNQSSGLRSELSFHLCPCCWLSQGSSPSTAPWKGESLSFAVLPGPKNTWGDCQSQTCVTVPSPSMSHPSPCPWNRRRWEWGATEHEPLPRSPAPHPGQKLLRHGLYHCHVVPPHGAAPWSCCCCRLLGRGSFFWICELRIPILKMLLTSSSKHFRALFPLLFLSICAPVLLAPFLRAATFI